MSRIKYLSGWKPELCIQLDNGSHRLADFNRFLVKGFPSTVEMKQSCQFDNADRESYILQLKGKYDEEIEEGASHRTLYTLFRNTSLYLRWCDTKLMPAFTQHSIEGYMSSLQNAVMLGQLKRNTYSGKRSSMVSLFTKYLDLPHSYFDNVIILDGRDVEPFEAYTRSDLIQLLPFLRQLFKQTYQQFIEAPDMHITAYRSIPTMTFEWKNEQYPLCGGITKMMCAATYLLAYYTYTNTSDLLNLKQPNNASMSVGDSWYTMPAFKRRAFKTIQIEIGNHELEIPKYSLDFFDKLLKASTIISDTEDTTLLKTASSKRVQPLKNTTLQAFLKIWVEKHFTFIDQTGRRLRPVISRFRETGSQLTSYHQGEMVNNLMLNNTPNTRKRHYSEGNKLTNNGMMQDVMSIREEQIKSRVSTQQAQKNLSIEVL
ncbi:hypothetical protein ACPDLO_002711, partial [Vibrio cholerae]